MDAAKFVAGYERVISGLQGKVAVLEEVVAILVRSHPNATELSGWWAVAEKRSLEAVEHHGKNESFEYFVRRGIERFSQLIDTRESSARDEERARIKNMPNEEMNVRMRTLTARAIAHSFALEMLLENATDRRALLDRWNSATQQMFDATKDSIPDEAFEQELRLELGIVADAMHAFEDD